MSGIYAHIPFCESRCIYCGFYSTTLSEWQSAYVDALLHELNLRASYLDGSWVNTVYVGGGTPSLLSFGDLERLSAALVEKVDSKAGYEFTLECNPEDVTADFARFVASLPVNRVSMGVQTFSDPRLRFLNRRHDSHQAIVAYDRMRSAGIGNISLDLMFGFPGETLADVEADLKQMTALRPEHVSAYSLQYEEGTKLYSMLRKGEVEEVGDEESLAMYDAIIDGLATAGYEHYEISNFAWDADGSGKSKFRSRHNSSYWHDEPYLGLGASAHSYDRRSRQWNVADVRAYIDSIGKGIVPAQKEIIDASTHYDDLITTAMRTREGIEVDILESKYADYMMKQAASWIESGHLALSNGHLHLTRRGLFISDMILSDLMYV